jgi:TrmH family RNA methyltransferase
VSPPDRLAAVRVVLVRPRQPGNVGLAARAVANHGAGRLCLVAPRGFDPDQARWMAPHAQAVIDQALFTATIAEAVADCALVVGTSARARRADAPLWDPARLAREAATTAGPVAVVFGPEDAGLSNDDLAACDAAVRLPTAAHSSLNLGMAVGVTLAWMRGLPISDSADRAPPRPAAGLRDGLTQDLLACLDATDYLRAHPRAEVAGTLQRLFAGPGVDAAGLAALRGMAKALRVALGRPPGPRQP